MNAAGGSGSAGTGATDSSECDNLSLDVGATAAHGTTPLFKASSILDIIYGVGIVGSDLYFVANHQLEHVPIAGGAPVVVGPFAGEQALLVGSTLIWVEPAVAPATTVRILSAPASDISKPSVVADGVPDLELLIADADTAFFDTRTPANIYSVPIAGGTPKVLVASHSPLGMVSDGTTLYWLDFDAEQLESVPKAGGAPQLLAESFFGGPMVHEGNSVYWADTSQNTINRWSTGDTMTTQLWETGDFFDQPDSIGVNAGTVYWTQGTFCTGLWQLQPNAAKPELLVNGFQSGSVLTVDSTHLYVEATDGIYRVDR